MEQTNILTLDFTQSSASEEFVSTFAGDFNSRVIELNITPALSDGELLLCTVSKIDGEGEPTVVQSMVVTENRLVLPSSMLQSAGRFVLVFAVADVTRRLTASRVLNVSVSPDGITLVPSDSGETDTSAVSGIMAYLQNELDRQDSEIGDIADQVDSVSDGLLTLRGEMVASDTLMSQQIATLGTSISSIASTLSERSVQLAGLLANLQNGNTKISTGSFDLMSPEDSAACMFSQGIWIRINNIVLISFGFATAGYTTFTVKNLPFASSGSVYSGALVSNTFSGTPSVTSDFNIALAQVNYNSKILNIKRSSSGTAILTGYMIYPTNDLWTS